MNGKTKNIGTILKNNQWLLMFAAVILGIIATMLVNIYIRSRILTISGGGFVPVIVLARDIPANSVFTDSTITVQNIPASLVHNKMISAKYKDFVLGQRAATKLFQNQSLLWNDITVEKPPTLSQKLKLHQRAVSIFLDDAAGLTGLLNPGDRVDVVGFFDIPSADYQKVQSQAKVILQNITVLAVGTNISPSLQSFDLSSSQQSQATGPGSNTVTLRINLEDVPLLIFAQKTGRICLSLRGIDDIVTSPLPEADYMSIKDATNVSGRKKIIREEEYPVIFEGSIRRENVSWPDDNFARDTAPLDPDLQEQLLQLKKEQKKANENN